MRTKALAIVSSVAVAGLIAHAQGTPAGPNLKEVLFGAANALGMLRSLQQQDSINTVEFWATGTMSVGGQLWKVTNYRGSVSYNPPGMRAEFTRTGGNGQTQHQIEVVSGRFAWNETEPGMNATAAQGSFNERILRMWTITPQGVVKAASAAGASTKVTVEGRASVLTFPIAAVPGSSMKATLNAEYLVERVETRFGNTLAQTTFSDYGEWNDSDYRADVFLPRHIVQTQGGAPVLDLTITRTNTLNPYVIMPVPDTIEKAAAAQRQPAPLQ